MSMTTEPADTGSPMIPLGQVPTMFAIGAIEMVDGRSLVALQVSTPLGMMAYFIEPEQARKLGRELIASAKDDTGLIVPPKGLVVPV